MIQLSRAASAALIILTLAFTMSTASDPNFESPPVHPVEMSPNGEYLFVTHTADHRIVVYYAGGPQLIRIGEVMVGIEPVTARALDDNTVWVVNHVSGSISIVDVLNRNVARTLLVGHQPTDVVFAGGQAYVSVSQDDMILVYDLANLGATPTEIPLPGSDPRSLAVSDDGGFVYVTIRDSGNNTTVIPFQVVDALGGAPPPDPPMNPLLPAPPRVGLIVKHDGTDWLDDAGGSWNVAVPYTMPDNDVIEISTSSNAVTRSFHAVGTTLFNVAVHPITGDLYVTNQESFNEIRFEPNLRGQFVRNRITRIETTGGAVEPYHLNTHIDYDVPEGDATERSLSLAIPLDVAIAGSGDIYVTAFGSGKVGVLDAAGNITRRITVGEGPAGIAVDEARRRLYVYNRFSSSLSVVDLMDDSSVELSLGFDPSPSEVLNGRRFLYDGETSSAHGDLACASCHIFGEMDNVAWDLGDPTASSMIPVPPGQLPLPPFHPMKGPMTTQTLKGLEGTGPLHWRGDRNAFADFNPAFVNLMGREMQLDNADMIAFEDFVNTMRFTANPLRELDDSYSPTANGSDPVHGEFLFSFGNLLGANAQCVDCHALPTGENGVIIPGNLLQEDEAKVVPQLRNMHEKTRFAVSSGQTIRGYGYIHDGSVKDLFEFLEFPAFQFQNDDDQRDVEAFLLAFDTGTHPAVGAQLTMDGTNGSAFLPRLMTLEGLADAGAIGLVAKGIILGQQRGWVYAGGQTYTPDKVGEPELSRLALLAMAGENTEITFTGVVDGCQWRLGVDRDLDGHRDGDEQDAGSDPGDPSSVPNGPATGIADHTPRAPSALWLAGPNPVRSSSQFAFRVGVAGPATLMIYDVRGRLVRRLVSASEHVTGSFKQAWDLRNDRGELVTSGIYFARLRTADVVQTKRVAVVR